MPLSDPPPPNSPSPPISTSTPEAPVRPSLDRRYFLRAGLNAVVLIAAGVLLIVLLGVLQRGGWIGGDRAAATAGSGAEDVVYTCPMHPQIRQPRPGTCPICAMPLELATTDGASAQDEYAVTIEPAARRLANIQTAPVQRRPVEKTVESIGRLAIDESRQATISAYVAGRIERLFADYTGVEVKRGDHIAVIYSPALYAAQVEYLESKRTVESMGTASLEAVRRAQERLASGTRQRLIELGMTAEQLDELDQSQEPRSRLTIYAPMGGTVIEKLAVEGKYVDVGESIYQIADLSMVWLMLQLFPEDAALVRFGQHVDVEVQSLPGKVFEGRVSFIDPVVDQRTRTVDVRIEMTNEDGLLRPGDYASARVKIPLGETGQVYDADLAGKWISPMHPQIVRDEPGDCPVCGMALVPTSRYGYSDQPVPQPELLVVPRRAVLMTGSTSMVYVETERGRFEIRPVRLGPLLRDQAVIVDGLTAGEQVAVSGNFLIDSQMQLAGKPSLIDPTRAIAKAEKQDGPLAISSDQVQPIGGDVGRDLEQMYQSYAAIVQSLAADAVPTEADVQSVEQAATQLAAADALPRHLREHAAAIAENVAHLHHQPLDQARTEFKAISHGVLRIAAEARGEQSDTPLIHFYCEMVPGGGGDWLQLEDPPSNPYWGSKMLRCTQHREELPAPSTEETRQNEPTAPENQS